MLDNYNKTIEETLEKMKLYGEDWAKKTKTGRKEFNYRFEPKKNKYLITNTYAITLKYYKKKPYKFLSYEIDDLIELMEENYGFRDAKVFAIPAGYQKEKPLRDEHSKPDDLSKIKVQMVKSM